MHFKLSYRCNSTTQNNELTSLVRGNPHRHGKTRPKNDCRAFLVRKVVPNTISPRWWQNRCQIRVIKGQWSITPCPVKLQIMQKKNFFSICKKCSHEGTPRTHKLKVHLEAPLITLPILLWHYTSLLQSGTLRRVGASMFKTRAVSVMQCYRSQASAAAPTDCGGYPHHKDISLSSRR